MTEIGEKSWGALLAEATTALREAGVQAPERTAAWMLGDLLGCSRAHLLAHPRRVASAAEAEALAARVARRLAHEPLQYILGHTEFYGLRLAVTPAVLIPRPETEQVVEAALARLPERGQPRVLDVGTGSGCIALALRHQRPDAEVFACDISEKALAVARANAEALGLDVSFFQADVRTVDFVDAAPGRLDLLLSNPPYVRDDEAATLDAEVRDFEPALALFAGTDPLYFYRRLAEVAWPLLVPGGTLVLETHADHGAEVRALLAEAGFSEVALQHDLAGRPRIVSARRPVED